MQEHDSEQTEATEDTGETVEQTDDETTAEAGADESATADAVEVQAGSSDGAAAEAAPEVPDDARETIARAQEHINSLNMADEAKDAQATTDGMAGGGQ